MYGLYAAELTGKGAGTCLVAQERGFGQPDKPKTAFRLLCLLHQLAS